MRFFKVLIISMISFYVASSNAQEIGEFSVTKTFKEIFGSEAKNHSQYIGEEETLSWDIYVPETYDASKPAGVMVYAGSPNFVRPPAGWLSVIKDKNLIWVASKRSGNVSSIFQKTLLAMASVPLIKKEYNIDDTRIYITGEGRSASRAALNYPDIFTGAILLGNRLWEDNAEVKIKNSMKNSFVFVTRESNAFPRGTREAYYKFKSAGVENLKLYYIRGIHRYNRRRFAESIDFLDG